MARPFLRDFSRRRGLYLIPHSPDEVAIFSAFATVIS